MLHVFVVVVFCSSFKTYSTAAVAVAQLSSASPLSLLGNVDVRSLSGASSGSLTEAGGEEDDEQNCPPYSGTQGNSVFFSLFNLYNLP